MLILKNVQDLIDDFGYSYPQKRNEFKLGRCS